MKDLSVGVFIPAYNEESTIARVILQVRRSGNVDKIVVCDDGSTDMTAEIAEALGADVIRHEHNMGYGAAIRTLFERARELGVDVMVTMDADGQHDPRFIPKLIEPILQDKADVVIGSRFLSPEGVPEVPWYRRFGIRLITGLANLSTKLGLTDAQSGFRAYSRRALEVINPTRSDMSASLEILDQVASHGLKIAEVPVVIRYRGLKETSTKNPLKHGLELIGALLDIMTWDRPLLYLGVPGATSLVVSLFFRGEVPSRLQQDEVLQPSDVRAGHRLWSLRIRSPLHRPDVARDQEGSPAWILLGRKRS